MPPTLKERLHACLVPLSAGLAVRSPQPTGFYLCAGLEIIQTSNHVLQGWSTYSCKAWLPRSLLAPSAPERHPCMALHGGLCPLTAGVSSVTDKLLSCSSVQVWGSRVHVSNYLGWRIPPSPTRWIRSGSEQRGLEAYHPESFCFSILWIFSFSFFLLLRKQY